MGGGVGGGFIVSDVEDIGTFGDWDYLDFLPTGLDREQKELGADDAQRQLLNRLKFGAELGFPIIPFVVGTGKVGKLLVQKGKELTYSDSMLERWIDRFVGKPFRSRSNKTQELFDGIQKLGSFYGSNTTGCPTIVVPYVDDYVVTLLNNFQF